MKKNYLLPPCLDDDQREKIVEWAEDAMDVVLEEEEDFEDNDDEE